MVREVGLREREKFSDLVSKLFDLPEFSQVGLAAIEELAILAEECGHVALKIVHLEIARRLVAFSFVRPRLYLLDEGDTAGAFGGRILLVGFPVGAIIEGRCSRRRGCCQIDAGGSPRQEVGDEAEALSRLCPHKPILNPSGNLVNETSELRVLARVRAIG